MSFLARLFRRKPRVEVYNTWVEDGTTPLGQVIYLRPLPEAHEVKYNLKGKR